ncbi:tetratricopeptide repeat protein [Streptomyces sp. KS 21]|nr:tetratricopeptide repeat protein [Streptomyces sp. KS 21]
MAEQVRQAIDGRQAEALSPVLVGAGGVGKTQLAADYARHARQSGTVDLLVWITASTRSAAVSGFSQAAVQVLGADPAGPERAAESFLAWLEPRADTAPCRWLVVLDDVADPADLHGLWPPESPHGRTLVTTRRRDAALAGEGRRLMPVGLFTPVEAVVYLSACLAAHGRHEDERQLAHLAADLGHLPLALSQATAYLIDTDLDCAAYRRLLADQKSQLADLLPEPGALPDDQSVSTAAAWLMSIDRANQLRPARLARPMLQLAAMLDPNGIPMAVLTSQPALAYLTATHGDEDEGAGTMVGEAQAVGALQALRRLSLIDHTPGTPHQAVRVHQLIQRAVRDALAADQQNNLARTAADALFSAWPDIERDTDLAQALRANTDALARHVQEALWRPDAHPVLFRTGDSLGNSGQVAAAANHYRHLAGVACRYLGPDHPDTLSARSHLAQWQGATGDAAGAATAYADLLKDRERVQGPDHPDTLTTRSNLARWRGSTGNVAGATAATVDLLVDMERVLGPDHPDTLTARGNLAWWRGTTGDAPGAAAAYANLLKDRERVQGPDHLSTLTTRHDSAWWRGMAGDAATAATAYTDLLADVERVLGPDHPRTLTTRSNLAWWRGMAGDAATAATAYTDLLTDVERVLGPDHPGTLTVRHNLAYWRGEAGDPAGAAAAFAEVLADRQRVLGPHHPVTLTTRHNLARWQGEAGDSAGAVTTFTEVLADRQRVLGPHHPNTLATQHELAQWQGRVQDEGTDEAR